MRMILSFVSALTIAAGAVVAGQADSITTVPATGGDIVVTPLMRMSVQIEHAGKVIHVDPTAIGAAPAKPGDLILVTDIHRETLDIDQIAKIRKPGAPVVMPAAVAKMAGDKIAGPTNVVANGETVKVGDITIEAVPAYNASGRGPKPGGEAYFPKGRGNGYVVTIGGKRLFFAGKTECTPEIKAIKDIEVAFLPMQMPETMQPYEAGECAKVFMPKTVYAYHYDGHKNDEAFFRAVLKPTPINVKVQIQ
ncbi:MAG: hypothetical protein A3F70_04715 [Acidobacteria bacterium RIFCSPLOWO2_12_FULL_67_14]|nr:MAG: hypothetical protein A3H29_13710 [Acidobacteria bacterium RIFCSPLOWO2_02_FULL_67_21]OFW35011.1 MAG: hypothetical protein A3F70_04715 [Acidobacteria bacterium RIFCSPLOWO2_12_FULL_67_14]